MLTPERYLQHISSGSTRQVKSIAIERKRGLSAELFARDHVANGGMPVILTDAMDAWPARTKWTLDFFRTSYGSDLSAAPLGLDGDVGKVTRLAEYIGYLDHLRDLPGFLVNIEDGRPATAAPGPDAPLPYLLHWKAFELHPELYDDIKPAPACIGDFTWSLDPAMRTRFQETCGREYWSVYLGPAGSLSSLHQDFWNTHAYLAQVQGRKRATLFSPADSGSLYGGDVDPERPDAARFPLYERATPYECVLEPGELLFMPGDWWHHVRGLDKTITLSHNFFNETNFSAHMARLLRRLAPQAAE